MGQNSIPFFRPSIDQSDLDAVAKQLSSGWLTRGNKCNEFEQRFTETVRSEHAISTSSCTSALSTSLMAQNLQDGECVILPDLTFTATAEAVLGAGGIPVLVDCIRDTRCIDPTAIERAIDALRSAGHTTSFVLPVHYGGVIADIDAIHAICDAAGLKVIHDAAHCLESMYFDHTSNQWRSIGELPGTVCYSFYANKCITTCEGGMITTNDASAAETLRRMSLHGIQGRRQMAGMAWSWNYEVVDIGFKANLPDPLAALGISQLARSQLFHDRRSAIAERYHSMLSHLPVFLPICPNNRKSSWHLYVVQIDQCRARLSRDEVYEQLAAFGINCSVHWRPLSKHQAYRELIKTGRVIKLDTPTSDAIWPQLLSLPIYPDLTEDEQTEICETLERILAGEN